MAITTASKSIEISQATNPKLALINAVGDISREEILRDQVLVAIYIRPEKTKGGVLRPTENIKEDEFQGKVGLIIKAGPEASEYSDDEPPTCGVGDWVVFTIRDGIQLSVNGVACRLIPYERLRMKITNPELVF